MLESQPRHSNLLEIIVNDFFLDLDESILLFILGLGRLDLGLVLSLCDRLGCLGLLGWGKDFLIVRVVAVGRQDNRRRAFLSRRLGRSLGSTLDVGVVCSIKLLLQSGPGVSGGTDGEARALRELR